VGVRERTYKETDELTENAAYELGVTTVEK